ncbi:MAG: hypothetical protein HMLKMBBP_03829 [Planctomycetes bacterium]|nr:hypothetical protein [Planctomycetota bacterium]
MMDITSSRPFRARRPRRGDRGTVLPVVLALSIGVGALAAGYTSQVMREHSRERWERNRQQAYFDAWAQMEVVASIINTSPYDSAGKNIALDMVVNPTTGRADRTFIDRDGWMTHVRAAEIGGAGSGYYELTSIARVEDAEARVSALVRERASFADFVWFVNSHDLGVAGGVQASSPWADSPEGNIHSNQRVQLYFADRHFRDPVTAVNGFLYQAGATAENQNFHDQYNPAAATVTGLMSVVPSQIGQRSDAILNLDGPWDQAKVKLLGDTMRVEHWRVGHNEQTETVRQQRITQTVTQTLQSYHYATLTQTNTIYNWSSSRYTQTVTNWYQSTVSPGYYQTATVTNTTYQTLTLQQTGGSGSGGGAIGGGNGYYTQLQSQTATATQRNYVNPVVSSYSQRQTQTAQSWYTTGYYTQSSTYSNWQAVVPASYYTQTQTQTNGWTTVPTQTTVWVNDALVSTYQSLPVNGVLYCTQDLILDSVSAGESYAGRGTHVLNGSLTLATGDDLDIRDSITYGHVDGSNVFQPAYLNGTSTDANAAYEPNPNYQGTAVLGLVAYDDIRVMNSVPDVFELNATLLASQGEYRTSGINVSSNGSISQSGSGSFVKEMMRSLGGVISNQRPVTTMINGSGQIIEGFRNAKTVYDVKQRTNPPRGFPTINRPRLLTRVLREVN